MWGIESFLPSYHFRQKTKKERCRNFRHRFFYWQGRLFLSALLAYHVGCAKAEQHGYAAAQRGGGFVVARTVAGKTRQRRSLPIAIEGLVGGRCAALEQAMWSYSVRGRLRLSMLIFSSFLSILIVITSFDYSYHYSTTTFWTFTSLPLTRRSM